MLSSPRNYSWEWLQIMCQDWLASFYSVSFTQPSHFLAFKEQTTDIYVSMRLIKWHEWVIKTKDEEADTYCRQEFSRCRTIPCSFAYHEFEFNRQCSQSLRWCKSRWIVLVHWLTSISTHPWLCRGDDLSEISRRQAVKASPAEQIVQMR